MVASPYTVRNYRSSDFDSLVRFFQLGTSSIQFTPQLVTDWLSWPDFTPEQDLFIVEIENWPVTSQPGDWDYDPIKNESYRYNPDDPYSDLMVVLNTERILNAIKDSRLDFTSERFRHVYLRLKELSE